ncbi:hypothetical protein WL51_06730 [Burkholderia ubonensis]|nr:hypothetical protein WL51_06730 [Burkholderia ubonensis]
MPLQVRNGILTSQMRTDLHGLKRNEIGVDRNEPPSPALFSYRRNMAVHDLIAFDFEPEDRLLCHKDWHPHGTVRQRCINLHERADVFFGHWIFQGRQFRHQLGKRLPISVVQRERHISASVRTRNTERVALGPDTIDTLRILVDRLKSFGDSAAKFPVVDQRAGWQFDGGRHL